MKQEIIVSAKTVDAAVKEGAEKLGVKVEEVTYEVITEPKKGFFGFGEVKAEVKVVYEKSMMSEKGQVIRQSIASGTQVTEKTTVTITVGTGDKAVPDSGNGGNGSETNGPTVTKEVTVMLPPDEEQVAVRVTANGKTVYEGIHNTSEGAISVPVTGNGNVVVVAYIDGQKVTEKTIKF